MYRFLKNFGFLLDLFIVGNLGFLAFDIYLAHSVNMFGHWAEWIPFYFSIGGTILYLLAMLFKSRVAGHPVGLSLAWLVGLGSIVVGIAGLIFHLNAHFFIEQTLHSLTYAAPFVAPLSYTGVGLLIILNQMMSYENTDWGRWVMFLACGGFIGNFGLSLVDHAQNGFFYPTEWIPVVTSAFAITFLMTSVMRGPDRKFDVWTGGVMMIQILVGVLGFYLHARGNLHSPFDSWWDKFIYGAPIFAPLLFANLALLALLGLAATWQSQVGEDESSTSGIPIEET